MCGINGILRVDPQAPPPDAREALRSRDSMKTRGPDGAGLWADAGGHVVLGHRRLAVIDLSDAGLQPMASADGRYRIVLNGEIYNYKGLRAELSRDYTFRSHSDTEVILALFARDGLPALGRLRGMFAFAIWDDRDKRLLLARDPNGIKPLYYSTDGRHLRFASQVKALVAGGAVATREDPAGLCGFLLWGSVPEPWTIYESVKALPAGHLLWAGREGVGRPEPLPPASEKRAGAHDIAAAIEESVVAHLVSDVPVAVFLSSGLDSSLVAALAKKHLADPPVTMTLRFREFAGTEADEGPLAAEVARALGTHHVERWVSKAEFLEAVPAALAAMDQPSIDGLNTYWMSRCAHEAGIKVALSGLGGDELLGGYPSFRQVPRLTRWAGAAGALPGLAAAWPSLVRLSGLSQPKLPGLIRYGRTMEGAYFLRRALYLPEDLPGLIGPERAAEGLRACDPEQLGRHVLGDRRPPDGWRAVQALETSLYLRNQLLRDSDWASMASSLELRVPFVDAWLQDAAGGLDQATRRSGKAGVARSAAPELPQAVFSRRKTGFLTPFADWLDHRAPMRTGEGSRSMAWRILSEWGLPAPESRSRRLPATEPRSRPPREALVLAPSLFAEPGGIQTYCRNLTEALRQLGALPTVLALNDEPHHVVPLLASGGEARGFGRRHAAFAIAAARLARSGGPKDVWLAHRNFTRLAPLLRRSGSRVSLILYGIDAWPRLSWAERQALRSVDHVLAISPHTADCYRRAGFAGEIGLLPCSLPFGWTTADVTPPRFQPPYRVLSVSRLAEPDENKGLDHTIEAVALVRASGLQVCYHIAGDGPGAARLRKLAEAAGIADAVVFHGRVDDQHLRRLYEKCDMFVLASAVEGFGIVYLEALAHERPVIAADAGGVPFFIRQGETGWLVPYGDPEALANCIRDRIRDPEGSIRSARHGRQMVEQRFSFAAFSMRVSELLGADQRRIQARESA
jgi:asparagine synthase (glutamine-hydrolysing)